MRVGLATIQRGRLDHVERQVAGVADGSLRPDAYVVLSMDPAGATAVDERVAAAVDGPADAPRVLRLPVADGAPLPLAEARNTAIRALGDVDLAVLLDVDCIPGPELLARYAEAAAERDGLLAGPVGHLPAGRPTGVRLDADDRRAADVRGARPVPGDGELLAEPRHELFWSLSFAVSPETHARIGGFDEGYTGYGGEDTDYAFRARRSGVPLTWVGGAWAFHQHHTVSSPPREHLRDIVHNARRFREVWGRWPMEGWLAAFAAEDLVAWSPEGDRLELLGAG
ncbi:glycosyltransferase family 2 protein [Patulibacter sp.]|uniref:glycosyltransferase family 2 protein n=1 Tax=Patulibacter sp. TaxID=1912859 RepID=UPI00271CF6C4|nr:galactosyltransferase-related protein [Patulibacter sp.]MDO9408537.1 galactosyltransferase-related protein [Patulibacter sp.]